MSRGFTAGYEPVAAPRLGDPPRRAKLCDRNAHHAAEHRGILSGVGGHAHGFRNPIDSFYPEWVARVRNGELREQIVRPLQGRHDWWSVLSGGGVPFGGLATGYFVAGLQPARNPPNPAPDASGSCDLARGERAYRGYPKTARIDMQEPNRTREQVD